MSLDEFEWNKTIGGVNMKYISDNQFRTGIKISAGAHGEHTFDYSFIYGNINDPTIKHDVKIPMRAVISTWHGDLSEAIIQSEGKEYAVFKKMIQDKLAYAEDDKEIARENRINNTRNM